MNGRFIEVLDEYLKSGNSFNRTLDDETVVRSQRCPEGLSLQMIVLDKAFQTLTEKYQRHLELTRPALAKLLAMNEENHEASDLKELLAVKISLTQFERNIQDVRTEINTFSRDFCEDNCKEDLRMIVEFFNHNIQEIEFEMRKLTGRIEDCEQFVSIHLDSVRNQIMKIGVFFEFAALTSGFGMLVGGFFGMNTMSGLEETEHAWAVTVLLTLLFMALIMGCFMRVFLFHTLLSVKSLYYLKYLCSVLLPVESRHHHRPEVHSPQELLHMFR